MRGNFGLKLQNSPKLPCIHARFIVMQMSKVNREKGYYLNYFHARNQSSSVWKLKTGKHGLTKRKWTKEQKKGFIRRKIQTKQTYWINDCGLCYHWTISSAALPSTAGSGKNCSGGRELKAAGIKRNSVTVCVPSKTLRYLMSCSICSVRRFSKRITTWRKLRQ